MIIQTSRFGELNIDENTVIRIHGGLIGFPEYERYLLLRHNADSPFFWLQAVDHPDLAFVVVDPLVFKPDYKLNLPGAVLSSLMVSRAEELNFFVIVTIPQGQPTRMTANLLGPVAFNAELKIARQLVLDEKTYSHQHPILAGGKDKGRTSRGSREPD